MAITVQTELGPVSIQPNGAPDSLMLGYMKAIPVNGITYDIIGELYRYGDKWAPRLYITRCDWLKTGKREATPGGAKAIWGAMRKVADSLTGDQLETLAEERLFQQTKAFSEALDMAKEAIAAIEEGGAYGLTYGPMSKLRQASQRFESMEQEARKQR